MKPNYSLRNTFSGLFLAACLAACSKAPEDASTSTAAPPAAAAASATPAPATYGFMSQIPQDVQWYTAMYNARKVWQRFVSSRALATVRASGIFQTRLNGAAPVPGGARKALDFFSSNEKAISDPRVLELRHVLGDALGAEWFMSFSPGTTESLQTWYQLLREFRTQQRMQMFRAFAPGGAGKANPNWMPGAIPALAPYVHSLQCPPIVMGFKMSTQKTGLETEINRARRHLPAAVVSGTFSLGDKAFTSWTFVAGTLIPPDKQEKLKTFLETNIPDKAAADDCFQGILAKKVEACFGYVGDYFLLSLGPDHSHLKLAATPAESLLARPELGVFTPYGDKAVFSVAWSCQKILELLSQQQDVALLPAFESAKASLGSTLSDADVQKIEADLRRIDAKGQTLMHPSVIQAAAAVSYWKDGLHLEEYGGVLPAGLGSGKPLTFDAADVPSNFFWLNTQADPAFGKGMLDWLQDIAKTALDVYHHSVMPKLDPQKGPQFGMVEGLVLPRLIQLYHITRDQFLSSLGAESAVAVDLNGAVPPLPTVPSILVAKGKMPRVAFIRSIVDRQLLGKSWQSYLDLARQLAIFLPAKMQPPGGLPDAQHKDVPGGEMYFYPLPLDTGDLLPNVTLSGTSAFIESTSPSYASDISGALKAGASGAPSSAKFELRLTAAYDFAEAWIHLANDSQGAFFQNKPDAQARFQRNVPKMLELLKGARLFQGMEGRFYEENGGLRLSAVFHIHDIP